jgi:hypothetical protein
MSHTLDLQVNLCATRSEDIILDETARQSVQRRL